MAYLNGLSNIVSINPKIRDGRACFKDTRIPVDYVLKHFAKGWNLDEVSSLFPDLKKEDIRKVQEHTSELLDGEKSNNSWMSHSR